MREMLVYSNREGRIERHIRLCQCLMPGTKSIKMKGRNATGRVSSENNMEPGR